MQDEAAVCGTTKVSGDRLTVVAGRHVERRWLLHFERLHVGLMFDR